jgi:hypothetical protein
MLTYRRIKELIEKIPEKELDNSFDLVDTENGHLIGHENAELIVEDFTWNGVTRKTYVIGLW